MCLHLLLNQVEKNRTRNKYSVYSFWIKIMYFKVVQLNLLINSVYYRSTTTRIRLPIFQGNKKFFLVNCKKPSTMFLFNIVRTTDVFVVQTWRCDCRRMSTYETSVVVLEPRPMPFQGDRRSKHNWRRGAQRFQDEEWGKGVDGQRPWPSARVNGQKREWWYKCRSLRRFPLPFFVPFTSSNCGCNVQLGRLLAMGTFTVFVFITFEAK